MTKKSTVSFDKENLNAWLDEHYPYGKTGTRRHAYPAQILGDYSSIYELFDNTNNENMLPNDYPNTAAISTQSGDTLKRSILTAMAHVILNYKADNTADNPAEFNPGYTHLQKFVANLKTTPAFTILKTSQGTATSFFQRFSSIFPRFSKTSSVKALEEMLFARATILDLKNQHEATITRADISAMLNNASNNHTNERRSLVK